MRASGGAGDLHLVLGLLASAAALLREDRARCARAKIEEAIRELDRIHSARRHRP